jgi:hypothetical protein
MSEVQEEPHLLKRPSRGIELPKKGESEVAKLTRSLEIEQARSASMSGRCVELQIENEQIRRELYVVKRELSELRYRMNQTITRPSWPIKDALSDPSNVHEVSFDRKLHYVKNSVGETVAVWSHG